MKLCRSERLRLSSWGDDSVQSRHRHQSLKPLSPPKQDQVHRIYALQVSHGRLGRVEEDGIINGCLRTPTVPEFLNLVAETASTYSIVSDWALLCSWSMATLFYSISLYII